VQSSELLNRQEITVDGETESVLLPAEPEIQAENSDKEWEIFKRFLIGVLGKVMAQRQATDLINSVIQRSGIKGVPSNDTFPEIAASLTIAVPHRGKKAALIQEIHEFLAVNHSSISKY
jgi:hypothetical protein